MSYAHITSSLFLDYSLDISSKNLGMPDLVAYKLIMNFYSRSQHITFVTDDMNYSEYYL